MMKGNSYDDMIHEGFQDDDDNNNNASNKQYYKCTKDDTLVSISIRFDVSVSKLKRINKARLIGGDKIFPGMMIRLHDDNSLFNSPDSINTKTNSNNKFNSNSNQRNKDNKDNDSNTFDSIFKAISPLSTTITNGISSLSLMSNGKGNTSLSLSNSISNFLGVETKQPRDDNKVRRDNGFNDDNIDHDFLSKELAHVIDSHKSYNDDDKNTDAESLEPAPRDIIEYQPSGPQLIGLGKILTLEYARQLRHFLPRMLQIENMSLLYSMLNDGSDMTSFYRNIKGSQYSILIIETTKGGVFGGFTSVPWKITTKYYGTGECFLFKVDNNGTVINYPWSLQNDFFMYSSVDQVAMGGGADGFGFIIDKDFITGSTQPCPTFNNPSLTDEAGTSFKILNAECWGFQSYIKRSKFGRSSPR